MDKKLKNKKTYKYIVHIINNPFRISIAVFSITIGIDLERTPSKKLSLLSCL